jgi:hypothetical protein
LKIVSTGQRCVEVIYTRNHGITSIETKQIYSCPKTPEANPAARERFCNWYFEAVCNVFQLSILEAFVSQKTINIFTAVRSYNHAHRNPLSPEAKPVSSAHCPVTSNEIATMGGAYLTIAEAIVLPTSSIFRSRHAYTYTHKTNKTTDSSTSTNICAPYSHSSRLAPTLFAGVI